MTSHVRDSRIKFSRSFVTSCENFTGDFDFAFETDKLFEENDDIFGANDLLFNKETKQSPTTVQENTGPSSNSGRFAELENEDLDSILNR